MPRAKPKSKAKPLPPPIIGVIPSACVACGYELAGAARCAECGLSHASAVVLAGVPRRDGGSKGRVAARWTIFVLAAVFSQVFVLIVLFVSAAVALAAFVAIVLATVALVATGERGRRSSERVLFSPDGILRVPIDAKPGPAPAPTPWTGAERVHTREVGALWQRLEILAPHPAPPHATAPRHRLIDMGFRCERADLARVHDAIAALSRGEPIPAAPPPHPTPA